ncbi:penicillin-binding protein 2 [Ornithinimicrobium faecis]|uniref:penicillin-binding protein 2 n=1 Tax=Ornithinimicrobium faecis TaxID=2934158 RepID=UPI0021183A1B|nr:penicillin-binding protein 2 [Ornithinimicrobium sp. HY1745]
MGLNRRGDRPVIRVPRPQVTPRFVRHHRSLRPLWGLMIVTLVLGTVLAGRLLDLQVINHPEVAQEAAEVNTRVVTEPALRGRILAADGTPLASNAPVTVITVEPETLMESEDEGRALIEDVAGALELPVEALWGRTRVCGTEGAPPVPSCFSGSPYEPIPIAFDVDPVAALAVLERPERFAGIAVDTSPVRTYPTETVNAAHVLGYLGRPTQDEVDAGEGLTAQDLLGRTGLEATYDTALRGASGQTTVTVDPRGVVTGRLDHSDPVGGDDVLTHLDARVQGEVERILEDTVATSRDDGWPADSAAAVVLDVRTGGVVAAASYPTYDPLIWTTGVSQAEYDELTAEESGEPLINRAVAETFPPASTFKVVSLPAALETGIDPAKEYACPGSVTIGGQQFTNFESQAHGALSLQEILEVSCDTVFYTWAYDEWQAQGGLAQESDLTDPWVIASEEFGLGQPTGIDLPGEASGTIPGREWKRDYWEVTREDTCARAESGYPEVDDQERREFLEQLATENCTDGWHYRPGDAVNFSIGQGDLATTPLQIAVVYAAIANGGTLWEPQVADAVQTADGEVVEDVEPVAAGDIGVDPQALEIVRAGLEGVNTNGTGAGAFAGFDLEAYPVAGKTGSAESFGESSTAWYASYGPSNDPQYAVVVVIEEGGFGGEMAAPAARQIWDVLAGQ